MPESTVISTGVETGTRTSLVAPEWIPPVLLAVNLYVPAASRNENRPSLSVTVEATAPPGPVTLTVAPATGRAGQGGSVTGPGQPGSESTIPLTSVRLAGGRFVAGGVGRPVGPGGLIVTGGVEMGRAHV